MDCPFLRVTNTRVKDSRPCEDEAAIRMPTLYGM